MVGHLLGPDREPLTGQAIQLVFERRTDRAGQLISLNLRTDERGRFVTCRAPGDEEVTVRMRAAGEWVELADFIAGEGMLTYREIWFKR